MLKKGSVLKTIQEKKGFTLVEMMITVAVLSIILVFVSRLLSFNIQFVNQEDDKLDRIQSLRVAANHIINTVRENDSAAVVFDDTQGRCLLKAGNVVILDAIAKTSNLDNNSKLWLYSVEAGKGELRTGEDTVLAESIAAITITRGPEGRYALVTIVPEKADIDVKSLGLTIPLLDSAPLPTVKPSEAPSPTPSLTPQPSTTPYPTGELIGEFLFDGSSTEDTSGTNDEPNVHFVGIETAEGPPGMGAAMEFNGQSSYISIDNFALESGLENEITFDFWCYPEETGRVMVLFHMVHGDAHSGNGFQLYMDANGSVVFETKNNILPSTYELTPFNWYHIRASYASNGNKTLKITDTNGTGLYSGSIYAGSADIDAHDRNPLVVGVDPHNNPSQYKYYFKGRLDEIRLYKVAYP